MRAELTTSQKAYISELRKQLKNLDMLGQKGSLQWWSIVESIDAIQNNL